MRTLPTRALTTSSGRASLVWCKSRNTTRTRWCLRQRSASRRVLPSAWRRSNPGRCAPRPSAQSERAGVRGGQATRNLISRAASSSMAAGRSVWARAARAMARPSLVSDLPNDGAPGRTLYRHGGVRPLVWIDSNHQLHIFPSFDSGRRRTFSGQAQLGHRPSSSQVTLKILGRRRATAPAQVSPDAGRQRDPESARR